MRRGDARGDAVAAPRDRGDDDGRRLDASPADGVAVAKPRLRLRAVVVAAPKQGNFRRDRRRRSGLLVAWGGGSLSPGVLLCFSVGASHYLHYIILLSPPQISISMSRGERLDVDATGGGQLYSFGVHLGSRKLLQSITLHLSARGAACFFGHAREDGGVPLPPAAEGQPHLGEGAAPAGEGITLNNHPRGGIQQYTFGAAEKARRSIPSTTRGLCYPPPVSSSHSLFSSHALARELPLSLEQPRLGKGDAPAAPSLEQQSSLERTRLNE